MNRKKTGAIERGADAGTDRVEEWEFCRKRFAEARLMAIQKIDTSRCNGCKLCVDACRLDVIRFDENNKVAYIAYPEDCDFCYSCEMHCPAGCIYVYPSRIQRLPMPY